MGRRTVFKLPFNLGVVSSKGPEENEPGELRQATGCYYKPGDDRRIHKLPGRTALHSSGVAPSGTVFGVYLAQFDNGTDYLIALSPSGYSYREADPTNTEGFQLLSGLEGVEGKMFGIHYEDRHYLCNDTQQNLTVEASGTGLISRAMGMERPLPFQDGDVQAAGSGLTQRGSAHTTYPNNAQTQTGYSFPGQAYNNPINDPLFPNSVDGWAVSWAKLGESRTLEISGFAAIPAGSILNIDQQVSLYEDDVELGGFAGIFQKSRQKLLNRGFQSRVSVLFDFGNGYGSLPDGVAAGVVGITWNNIRNRRVYQYPFTNFSMGAGDFRMKFTHRTFGTAFQQSAYIHWLYDTNIVLSGVQGGYGDKNKNPFVASGFLYGYAEYDSTRGLQGPARWMKNGLTVSGAADTDYNSVVWTLPSGGPVNPNADQYLIYRTAQEGVAPADLGVVAEIDIPADKSIRPVFVDRFVEFDENTQPPDLYEVLEITQPDGTSLPFDLHEPPPPADFITVYQDSVVLIPQSQPRSIRYSEPGLPESFPLIYEISKFPLPENDQLVTLVPLDRVLMVLMKEAVVRVTDLPFVSEETYSDATTNRLEGIPGCVGRYAACSMSMAGEPAAAWVSRHGIYLCDGALAGSITEEIRDLFEDETITKNLGSAVLKWDDNRDHLIFAYDSDGDGFNDRYYLGHLNERHIKGQVFGRFPLPKWTGPHYGNITDLAIGEVADVQRIYSGHPSDGQVYIEWSGVSDQSMAASGVFTGAEADVVPMLIKTGKLFTEDYTELNTFKFSLRHSDWGDDEYVQATFVFKRDHNLPTSGVVSKSVQVNKERGTEIFFGRQAETLEVQLEHTTSGTGSITDLRGVSRKAGGAGER